MQAGDILKVPDTLMHRICGSASCVHTLFVKVPDTWRCEVS